VSRSLRHPFGEKRIFGSPSTTRPSKGKSKQPRMRQSRFSVEAILDAPDTTESRPGLRLRIVGIAMAGLFALLGLRLWALQVLQAPAAAQAVVANQIRSVPVSPTRGLILDRNGNPLVGNVVTEQITLSRVAAQQDPAVIGRLAALVGETPARVQAAIANQQYSLYKPVPIMSNAPLADIVYIKEHQAEFPGVTSVQTTQRSYPQAELPGPAQGSYPAAQVLGYVGTINAAELKSRASQGYLAGDAFGQSGLEYQYETALRGNSGHQLLEVDPQGQVAGVLKTVPSVPGANIVTNIDTNLQQVADNALATQIGNLRKSFDPACNNNAGCHPAATGGAVVVMSPQTGAVYAMSSYPSYNPSVWVGGISQSQYAALSDPTTAPLLNRAIDGVYTPGSTFKLSTATAALQSGLWNSSQLFDDTGTYTAPGCQYQSTTCTLHNAPGDGALGYIDMSTALTASDDDFFYNLGAQFYDQRATFGQTPIQDVAAQYSLGQLTGIDLPGESKGRVDSQAERLKLHAISAAGFPTTTWYTGDAMEMAFGQGATVITPIEQAVAYATFANGGTRYVPQLAAAVVSPGGKVITRFTPQVAGRVTLSPQNYQSMLAGFEGVISNPHGTAYGIPGLSSFPGGLAGKTGTADTVAGKEPTAWFVAWGPTADPQYVVVCVIDQAGYGATAAAPVVSQIYSYLASHPVGPAVVPPPESATQSSVPLQLPVPTTTTSTTLPGTTTTTTTPAATTTTTTTTTGAPAG